jgi:hypothetical protein
MRPPVPGSVAWLRLGIGAGVGVAVEAAPGTWMSTVTSVPFQVNSVANLPKSRLRNSNRNLVGGPFVH